MLAKTSKYTIISNDYVLGNQNDINNLLKPHLVPISKTTNVIIALTLFESVAA